LVQHRLSPTVRNTALAGQQGERYDPVGTLVARIVTAEQASSASCYDLSATLLTLPSSGCCYVLSATSPAESARALRNALAAAAAGGRGVRGEAPPPGMLAIRLAGRLVEPTGRDARRSRANVRHPAAAQLPTAQPFALDGLPGTPACRPRSVAGEGRAFGACCFASKLRSPAGPALAAFGRADLTPRHSLRQPLRHSLRAGVAYP
jgi:hypothetical protein